MGKTHSSYTEGKEKKILFNKSLEERFDDDEELQNAREAHREILPKIFRTPGVTAVDVGYRLLEKKGEFDPEICLRIHVNCKIQPTLLKQQGQIDFTNPEHLRELLGEDLVPKPKRSSGKTLLNGKVPIDIIQAAYRPSNIQVERPRSSVELPNKVLIETGRTRVSTLVGGPSIGTETGQVGTIGLIVWDRTDGSACILSNWHVLAGRPGSRIGQACYQPGFFDGGSESDRVGSLKRWIFDRDGDAALAEINGNRHYCSGEVLGLWHPVSDSIDPWLGMKVRKWGRSTGFTEGFVDGLDLTINLDYGSGNVRTFVDQMHISPWFRGDEFSRRGDSGATLVTRFTPRSTNGRLVADRRQTSSEHPTPSEALIAGLADRSERRERRVYYAVGQLFAGDVPGSPFGEFGVASKFSTIQERLQFCLRPVFVSSGSVVAQQRGLLEQLGHDAPSSSGRATTVLEPGSPANDGRGGGPQPELEPLGPGGG